MKNLNFDETSGGILYCMNVKHAYSWHSSCKTVLVPLSGKFIYEPGIVQMPTLQIADHSVFTTAPSGKLYIIPFCGWKAS